MSKTSGAAVETEVIPGVGDDATQGPKGPRIRCPLCGWAPRPQDVWYCKCGHGWHTFDTGGVCPACLYQWTATACHACTRWSAHSAWYEY
jgi:hypothetical protein